MLHLFFLSAIMPSILSSSLSTILPLGNCCHCHSVACQVRAELCMYAGHVPAAIGFLEDTCSACKRRSMLA